MRRRIYVFSFPIFVSQKNYSVTTCYAHSIKDSLQNFWIKFILSAHYLISRFYSLLSRIVLSIAAKPNKQLIRIGPEV